MKKVFLLAISATLLFSSCNKDNGEPCVTDLASVAGTYKLNSLRFKPSGGNETEIISSLPACKRDDLYVLNANTVYNYQDAGTTCTPNGTAPPGSWSLSGTTMTLEGDVYTIQSFDCSNLIVYRNNFPAAGDKSTYTFKRQ